MIIFLFGEDSFRSRQKLNELKDKFLREVDPKGNSLTALDGETSSMEKINEAASSGTLLAKKRMVIVENLFFNKSLSIYGQLLEYLIKGTSDDNIIIFWDRAVKLKKAKNKLEPVKLDSAGKEKKLAGDMLKLFNFLAKQKFAQQFSAFSNTEAAAWTKKEVEARGGKISGQAAQMLAGYAGSDLWQINNDINKLISYKEAGKTGASLIEAADVELFVKGSFDENIFALTDAISNKSIGLAEKLLQEQIEAGMADAYLLAMIVRQIKILMQIRQALDSGHSPRKIMSILKLHPFVAQKGVNQARRFSLASLKSILNELVKIDYQMKTGQADAKTMLNLLIAKM